LAELRPNRAKRKLADGGVVSVAMGPLNPELIEHMCQLEFDAIWLEAEHGPVDFADIPDLTRACDLWGRSSIVRVNQVNAGLIYRTLDSGAMGIAVPHVDTAEDARAVVDAAKFGPIGHRGMFTSRQGIGVKDYITRANDETMIVVLIEDIVAVDNLPEILEVDNIDVFFVAPGDLAQSMGHTGQYDHPKVVATVERALKKITEAGRVAGTLVNDDTVDHYVGLGARFLSVSWTPWLNAGAQGYLDKVKAATGS
jgi:2-dehydro-3-deoxy-L-rhamnonate aldolase